MRDLSGTGGKALPVTLSALFEPGQFHDGDVTAVLPAERGGTPDIVRAQVDVLSRHDDGSLQHALVTLPIDLEPGERRELYLVPSPSLPRSGPVAGAATEDAATSAVLVELVARAGDRFTLRLDPPAAGSSAPLAGPHPGPLSGPLVAEWERTGRLASGDGELLQIEARVRWRRFAGRSGARVEVIVENCPPPGPERPAKDIDFERLVIVVGDSTLADLGAGVLHDRTRFVVRGATGEAAALPRLLVREEFAALVRAGVVPPYDVAHPLADKTAAMLAQKIVASDMNGDVRPAEWPLGIPLDPGPITRYMPSTGDRGDIGPIPNWAVLALQSRSVVAEDVLLAADFNGAASFPIHVRDAAGTMGLEYEPAKAVEKRNGGTKCPRVADRAHAPLLGAVSFLLTGEKFAEEEFAAQAAFCLYDWPHDGRYRYPGTRDFAWCLRTTMLAAKLLPDANPLKPYLRARVAANLRELAEGTAAADTPLHSWGTGGFESSGRKTWPCATQASEWQTAWATASLWWTWRLHGNGDARALFERSAQYYTRAYRDVGTTFSAPDGSLVTWTSGHYALSYSFPIATYTPRLEGRDWKSEPDSRRFIPSFAESLWWLRINLDHQFDPGKPPPLPIGPDGVGTLRAADWRPIGPYAPPPLPADSWVVYAMHWLAVVLEADGSKDGHAVYAAVKPLIDRQIAEPALRMVPDGWKK